MVNGVSADQCILNMNAVNPLYIPRNHKIEEALDAAVNDNDFELFRSMLNVVSEPYFFRPGFDKYAEPSLSNAEPYVTFCGT